MTAPQPEPEAADPFDPTSQRARQAAEDRLVMEYPVELEWPTTPDPAENTTSQ